MNDYRKHMINTCGIGMDGLRKGRSHYILRHDDNSDSSLDKRVLDLASENMHLPDIMSSKILVCIELDFSALIELGEKLKGLKFTNSETFLTDENEEVFIDLHYTEKEEVA